MRLEISSIAFRPLYAQQLSATSGCCPQTPGMHRSLLIKVPINQHSHPLDAVHGELWNHGFSLLLVDHHAMTFNSTPCFVFPKLACLLLLHSQDVYCQSTPNLHGMALQQPQLHF
eukprot:EG_transcript_17937